MGKIHTRAKRKKGLRSTRHQHTEAFRRSERKPGPKSFKTEKAAKEWAEKNDVPDDHVLHHTGSKYQWRPKPRG